MAIVNAGFELTDAQRLQQAELNRWFLRVYGPESARLNEAIRVAREERRRLTRLDWQLVAKIWHLKKEEKTKVIDCF